MTKTRLFLIATALSTGAAFSFAQTPAPVTPAVPAATLSAPAPTTAKKSMATKKHKAVKKHKAAAK